MQIPSVRRTLRTLVVLSFFVATVPLATLTSNAATQYNTQKESRNGCFNKTTANAKIAQSGSQVVVTFTIPPECDKVAHTLSLVVYKLNDGNWQNKINNQYIYAYQTRTFNRPGTFTMRANIPQCAYQADLVKGQPVNIASGAKQHEIISAIVGGNAKPCAAKPQPTPPQPAPTPQPPAPSPPAPEAPATTTTVTEEVSEVSGKGNEPTELVETGPGQVVAAAAGVSVAGSLGFRMFLRRRLSIDSQ